MTLAHGEQIIYEDESGNAVVDVRLQEGTAWLIQALIAELFEIADLNSDHVCLLRGVSGYLTFR